MDRKDQRQDRHPPAHRPRGRSLPEWINNDRRLRAILTQMRKIAAEATQLIMDEAKDMSAKV
jgi:hypothetical protein